MEQVTDLTRLMDEIDEAEGGPDPAGAAGSDRTATPEA